MLALLCNVINYKLQHGYGKLVIGNLLPSVFDNNFYN